jgi:hypothetical protein
MTDYHFVTHRGLAVKAVAMLSLGRRDDLAPRIAVQPWPYPPVNTENIYTARHLQRVWPERISASMLAPRSFPTV